MNPLTSWRLPVRLARRDAARHRVRTALVLVMIALPVLAVTAADVLIQTSNVSTVESLDRRLQELGRARTVRVAPPQEEDPP